MQLPPEAIEEFKQLIRDEYGVGLSDEEARESALKLLTLIKAIYKPNCRGS